MIEDIDEILKKGSIDQEESEEPESDSSADEEQEEQGESAAEDEPQFEKRKTADRFQVLTQHNKELKEKLDEMEAWRSQIEEERIQRAEQQEQSEIPQWFSDVMGENEDAWKGFMGMTEKMQDQVLNRISTQQTQAQQEEAQLLKQGEEWVDGQIELVKETYGDLSKSDLNKLMSIVEKYVPTDADGNLDFIKGYELMKALNPKPDNTRKRLTDTSNSSHTIDGEGYQGLIKVY